ncbi:MAG: DUF418 domain-containing protein [Bryobacteraceae bacterium]|nr:DUF418 domain-containing protein [Bryobacteraceae bacterium]
MRPTTVQERVREIDVLRGVALFGIIAANMRGFMAPAAVYHKPLAMWTGTGDRVAQGLIDCFVTGKFITLFALLFGLGFAIQMGRADERGEPFGSLHARRMAALAAIGAAHAFLVWWGDILLSYAAMGFVLLLFRERPQEEAALWAIVLYAFPVFVLAVSAAASLAGAPAAAAPPDTGVEALQRTIRIYADGTYRQMLAERAREWREFNESAPFDLARILSLFLCGMYVWRAGILQNLAAWQPALRRAAIWGAAIGVPGNAAYVLAEQLLQADLAEPTPATAALAVVSSISVPALSLAYACGVILLFQRERWRRRLMPCAAVGRMALTNYLLQSIVCTALSYGYGLGLFGRVGPLAGLAPTAVIYLGQAVLSEAWLRRFRYGPAEWLWRAITYGRSWRS